MEYSVLDIAEMFEDSGAFEVFDEIDKFLYVWGEDGEVGCIFKTYEDEVYCVQRGIFGIEIHEPSVVLFDDFDPSAFDVEDYDDDPRPLNAWLRDGALINDAKDY